MTEAITAPDLSILVVAYNSQAVIGACLESIPAACTGYAYEVLLIDNGDGGTAALVSAQDPNVRIVASRGNVGFAAGNNLIAAEATGRFLLLLNPDVVLKPEAIDRLMEATTIYPDAVAWGGVTLDAHDRPDFGNTVHVPSLREMGSRMLGRSIARSSGRAGIRADAEVAALSGSFVMFARAAWDEVGGLDERYFLYCEEVDLFYRLAQRGYRFRKIAKSLAYHDVGHGQPASPQRELYLNAGVMQFTQLHWSKTRSWLAFVLIWISAMQRFAAGRLLGAIRPNLARVAEKHRLVVLRPDLWRHGYDPKHGLLAKLKN